jgi:hypothetical protein
MTTYLPTYLGKGKVRWVSRQQVTLAGSRSAAASTYEMRGGERREWKGVKGVKGSEGGG